MGAIYTHHPKRAKECVFCRYWMGDANMQFVNTIVGYKFDAGAKGKCTKRNGAIFPACYKCSFYSPSIDAEKLL